MPALVMKFGGTSVGSQEAIRQVLNIIKHEVAQTKSVMVVSSAMGGMTDFLVRLINSATADDQLAVENYLDAIRQRHAAVIEDFLGASEHQNEKHLVIEQHLALLNHLRAACADIVAAGKADARLRDAVMSTGERLMVRMLAAILRVNGIPAEYVDASDILVTDHRHQNAQPLYEPSLDNARRRLLPLLDQGVVPVVTGYIGATAEGDITTLGRGGSDYSATYLASLIDASEVWIWTDVDGIMSGDPRKLKNAQIMDAISYQAVSEFAYFGAKVLHPRAVEPLIGPKIPLRVCNTFKPDTSGTYVNGHLAGKPKHLTAVTDIQGVLVFAPTVPPERQQDGVEPIQTIAETILIDHIHQAVSPAITVDSHTGRLLCYIVPTTARKSAAEDSVQAIARAFGEHYPDLAWRVEPVSIVAAIGVVDVQETMQVLNAVRSVKAELLAMGQGSPECALLVVSPAHTTRVLKRLHNMAVSTHHRLSAAGAGELCPPEVPTSRQRRASRKRRNRQPPQRGIPL